MELLLAQFMDQHLHIDQKIKINIVFVGKTGAGKTTLINTFANYFFDKTYKDERTVLVSQSMSLDLEGQTKEIKLKKNYGDNTEEDPKESDSDQSQSKTMKSHVYIISNEFYQITMIDTPGLLDTRGINEDIKNIENILSTIVNLGAIHAICLVHKSTDSRMDASFKYYTEEFRSILPERALKNLFVCLTNVVNPKKNDGLISLKQMNLPLDNVLFFENDCLLPFSAVDDEDYHKMSQMFWQTNEKNYQKLIIHCESLDPIPTQIFLPIVIYKTIFFKLDFVSPLQAFEESKTQIQLAINEIKTTML